MTRLQIRKCKFARDKVHLLRHIVLEEGISVDSDEKLAIADAATPQSQTELRSFLGLESYQRRLKKKFAKMLLRNTLRLHHEQTRIGKIK